MRRSFAADICARHCAVHVAYARDAPSDSDCASKRTQPGGGAGGAPHRRSASSNRSAMLASAAAHGWSRAAQTRAE
jgi:hypothetical protein